MAKIPGMGNVMAPLIDHLNTIEKGFPATAKTAALDFASTNMTMLMSGDRTSSYLDKLAAGAGPPGNAGGTDDAKAQALADEKAKALAVELAQRQQFFADLNEAADIYNQGLQEREDLRMQQTAERLQAEYDMRTQFFNDINEAEYMADRMRADYKEQLAREDADRERTPQPGQAQHGNELCPDRHECPRCHRLVFQRAEYRHVFSQQGPSQQQ